MHRRFRVAGDLTLGNRRLMKQVPTAGGDSAIGRKRRSNRRPFKAELRHCRIDFRPQIAAQRRIDFFENQRHCVSSSRLPYQPAGGLDT